MTPDEIYEQETRRARIESLPVAERNKNTLREVLADPKAMAAMDTNFEVWLGVDLESLGQLLVALLHHDARTDKTADIDRLRIRQQISFMIEDTWHKAINGFVADRHAFDTWREPMTEEN